MNNDRNGNLQQSPMNFTSIWKRFPVVPIVASSLILVVFVMTSSVFLTAQNTSVRSMAPGLENPPNGWTVSRETEVGAGQLAQFTKKLGVSMTGLFNTVVTFHNNELQINTLTAKNLDDAIKLKAILRKGKPNPLWVVQNGERVYEFVVRTPEQARLAALARNAFPIQPANRTYHVEFDAVPILHERETSGPDDRNRLFNLLIHGRTESKLASEISALSRHFEFASQIQLVSDLQSAVVIDWQSHQAEVSAAPGDAEFVSLKITNADKKFGLPMVRLAAEVRVNTNKIRPVDSKLNRDTFLSTNDNFPVNLPEIRTLVQSLVLPTDSDSAKLRKLLDWFGDAKNMRHDGLVGSRYGALTVLKQHYGRCWDYSDLFITMARIAGLPARQVFGWLFESEGHVWCDVVVDGHWQMVDPTTGTECGSEYLPFCVSASGEFPILYSSEVLIVEK